MASNIIISKGGLSVTIHTFEVLDDLGNKLFLITPPQTGSKQAGGPKPVMIVDLLRITRKLIINGNITHDGSTTANTIKDNLIAILEGASIAGGTCSLTYDGDVINGYIEKLSFTERASDEPDDYDSSPTIYPEVIKYGVNMTFVKGTQI